MTESERTSGSTASRKYTFRGNLTSTRHGWLRLTPAYSVHLVRELLADVKAADGPVLDPFCGTGTTLLACAERGLDCTTVDLNPFLVWLARAKTARYDDGAVDAAADAVRRMASAAKARTGASFVPNIHHVERWWDGPVLTALGRAAATGRDAGRDAGPRARDLISLTLCRAVIAVANVSFGHQSMSFKRVEVRAPDGAGRVARALDDAFATLTDAARDPLKRSRKKVLRGDSRSVHAVVGDERFGRVVTSPPYSNRMSYIRELRPYMYWLRYLTDRRDAGELDWRAIGGTWGAATSRLGTWEPDATIRIPYAGFERIVKRIGDRHPLLGAYVHRYFEDMSRHVASIAQLMLPGGRVHYVVGNSKFYDVMLPAQEIFEAMFSDAGFRQVRVVALRKRTSKRELFEYLVEGTAP